MKNKNSHIKRFEKIKRSFPVLRTAESGNLPHPNLEAGDPRQKPSGMTSIFREETPDRSTRGTTNFKGGGPGLRPSGAPLRSGFTLIELLVVVLIIGILVSIALPQYEMAVERIRATKAIVAVKALAEASERYYMANGFYPENSSSAQSLTQINEDLDVTVNGVQDFTIAKYHNVYIAAKRVGSTRFTYTISKTLAHGSFSTWEKRGLTCNIAATSDDGSRSAQLCKNICGTDTLQRVWGSGQYGCEFQY